MFNEKGTIEVYLSHSYDYELQLEFMVKNKLIGPSAMAWWLNLCLSHAAIPCGCQSPSNSMLVAWENSSPKPWDLCTWETQTGSSGSWLQIGWALAIAATCKVNQWAEDLSLSLLLCVDLPFNKSKSLKIKIVKVKTDKLSVAWN